MVEIPCCFLRTLGLVCAYLSQLSGMCTVIVDKLDGPLEVERMRLTRVRLQQYCALEFVKYTI